MIRAICLVAALSISTLAQAWWAPEWTQRKALALDTTGTGANTQAGLSEVPVLVRLHAGNFPMFLSVRDGGADFRFVAGDDQTPLAYHVEHFDPVSQIAMVWVKLPVVNPQASDQRFYLYFGNPAAVKGDDPGATWDVDTAAAYHFSESTGVPLDSTAYATPITAGEVIPNPASIVGRGIILSGTAPVVVADAPQLAQTPEKGWTVELWVKFDALPESPVYLIDRGAGAERLSLVVDGGQLVARHAGAEVTGFTPLAAGTWHHVGLVLGGGQIQLFLDGAQIGGAPVTPAALGGAIYVGGAADNSGLASVAIDELRISSVARSADALAFHAAIQGGRNDAVTTYGGDESAAQSGAGAEGGHASHFGIIINNVFGKQDAVVEQAVIVLCGVMAAIAIMVMFLKAVSLSRRRRATDKFLAEYQRVAQAAGSAAAFDSLLADADDYEDSPLFTVYQQGLSEIRARMSPAVGASPVGLDEKSLNAIRATLDAVIVREGQSLNSQLVLLTIAISGGPFIGLLGTVVGVMVTFAAIAATGDVNIAAIAPGMAAALLATVAGLGVAIPSLFGYNYLSAKAKDIGADMHVFADEFVARMNELYGR